eukprot:1143858-Pelagomonas_calceolata.AAC.1
MSFLEYVQRSLWADLQFHGSREKDVKEVFAAEYLSPFVIMASVCLWDQFRLTCVCTYNVLSTGSKSDVPIAPPPNYTEEKGQPKPKRGRMHERKVP